MTEALIQGLLLGGFYAILAALADLLRSIQNDLFDVGADLCTPITPDPEYPPLRITEASYRIESGAEGAVAVCMSHFRANGALFRVLAREATGNSPIIRRAIQKVLNDHDGTYSATARALKMHRRTLQRKLDKHPPKPV